MEKAMQSQTECIKSAKNQVKTNQAVAKSVCGNNLLNSTLSLGQLVDLPHVFLVSVLSNVYHDPDPTNHMECIIKAFYQANTNFGTFKGIQENTTTCSYSNDNLFINKLKKL